MNQRNKDRQDVSDLRFFEVSIQTSGEAPIPAHVLDTSSTGLSAIATHAVTTVLEPDQEVELVLEIGSQALRLPAIVKNILDVEGYPRFGFEFRTPNPLESDQPSNFVREVFDRRIAHRIHFGEDELVPAVVRDEEHRFFVEGILRDVSASGSCVEVGLLAAARLDESERVMVEFKLPGLRPSLLFPATIQGRRETGTTVHLAVEFSKTGTSLQPFTEEAILDFVSRRLAADRQAG